VNTTALIETGWAAIVPEPNLHWHELPPGSVMEWLTDLGTLAHRQVDVVPELRARYSAEEMDTWSARIASIPTTVEKMTTQRLFALCADLRVWAMHLDVPHEGDLEEWAIAHVNAAATKAFRAMVGVLLDLKQKETTS